MPGEILIYYLANIVFNSIIAFGISALMVEFFILILGFNRKKMFKTVYFFRMLPFLKIIYDIIFNFNTASWAVARGIDIVNRLPQSMTLHMGAGPTYYYIPTFYMYISIYNNYMVTLTDIFTQHIGFKYTLMIVLSLLTVSLFLLIISVIKTAYSIITTKIILAGSQLSKRVITNTQLIKRLESKKIKIWISAEKGFSPFSYGIMNPKIIIPANFYKKLTDEEYEALIVHEIGHIGWLNALTQHLVILMKSFFWFIPFIHQYVKKINLTRELTCDNNCVNYDCNSITLAELLKKAAFYIKTPQFSLMSCLYTESSPLLLRIKALLDISLMGRVRNRKSVFLKTASGFLILILSFLISFFILYSHLDII